MIGKLSHVPLSQGPLLRPLSSTSRSITVIGSSQSEGCRLNPPDKSRAYSTREIEWFSNQKWQETMLCGSIDRREYAYPPGLFIPEFDTFGDQEFASLNHQFRHFLHSYRLHYHHLHVEIINFTIQFNASIIRLTSLPRFLKVSPEKHIFRHVIQRYDHQHQHLHFNIINFMIWFNVLIIGFNTFSTIINISTLKSPISASVSACSLDCVHHRPDLRPGNSSQNRPLKPNWEE